MELAIVAAGCVLAVVVGFGLGAGALLAEWMSDEDE